MTLALRNQWAGSGARLPWFECRAHRQKLWGMVLRPRVNGCVARRCPGPDLTSPSIQGRRNKVPVKVAAAANEATSTLRARTK